MKNKYRKYKTWCAHQRWYVWLVKTQYKTFNRIDILCGFPINPEFEIRI